MDNQFKLECKVRDYECDLQGVVNNSVYQNYLEHARHEFLLASGVDFAEFSKKGVNLVVVRIEMDYNSPLKPGDEFNVSVKIFRTSKIRFEFHQNITRLGDDKLVVSAKVFGTCLNERGRPFIPKEVDDLFNVD